MDALQLNIVCGAKSRQHRLPLDVGDELETMAWVKGQVEALLGVGSIVVSMSLGGIATKLTDTIRYLYAVEQGPLLVHAVERQEDIPCQMQAKAISVNFIDISGGAPKRVAFSTTAPRWRIAAKGLCLEGRCSNAACEANGQMVIMSQRFGRFDLVQDRVEEKCFCPLCRQYVNPVRCGFVDCTWKWTGLKIRPNGSNERCQSADWTVCDSAYHTMPDDTVEIPWASLMIFTKENPVPDYTPCSICLDHIRAAPPGAEPLHTAPCGHAFHQACWDPWFAREGFCPSCGRA
eukprot:gnl/Hemi2/4089_TR1427_c0_g1_i1.p1 gnl/Hemi2/4089_TR1427_c0_g1~~gnl/Hemi2/4089_TR1427_c0_g1_i1.p1  ORF type:complete len:290 (+),score=71.75 gnl/Hemi2/4089_TR1427_c0_g1_i1:83-952(+)